MPNFEKSRRGAGEPEERRDITGRQFLKGNLPGTDTYDDGLDERGRLVRTGSTSTESGGTYMEDKGPNDMVRRGDAHAELARIDPEVSISDSPDAPLEDEDDAAARWLREHDPDLKD